MLHYKCLVGIVLTRTPTLAHQKTSAIFFYATIWSFGLFLWQPHSSKTYAGLLLLFDLLSGSRVFVRDCVIVGQAPVHTPALARNKQDCGHGHNGGWIEELHSDSSPLLKTC